MKNVSFAALAAIGLATTLIQPAIAAPQDGAGSLSVRDFAQSAVAANDERGSAFQRRREGTERRDRRDDQGRATNRRLRQEMFGPWRLEQGPGQQPVAEFHFARGNARIDVKCPAAALQPCVRAAAQLIEQVMRTASPPSASEGTRTKPDREDDDNHAPEQGGGS
jgi:hypothetical protein